MRGHYILFFSASITRVYDGDYTRCSIVGGKSTEAREDPVDPLFDGSLLHLPREFSIRESHERDFIVRARDRFRIFYYCIVVCIHKLSSDPFFISYIYI